MNNSKSDSYAKAGVDITAGYRAVELMKTHIARTMTSGMLSGIGGFGGLFELDLTGITKPVLVSGTDGVGTKLKLAFLMDKHEAGEVNMDTKALDGREAVVEMVREARVDAAEDRFFTNRANMDMADRVISIVSLVFGAVCVCALLAHVLFV